MQSRLTGIEALFILLFLCIALNVFLGGFGFGGFGVYLSGLFFFIAVIIIIMMHLIIGRVDYIFIIGCAATIFIKAVGVWELISDTLMVGVLAWGVSYLRYDLSRIQFRLIVFYGLLSLIVSIFQLLGFAEMHAWNTLMVNSFGEIDTSISRDLLYVPLSEVSQAQIRPAGLFHSSAVFSLFVCYFYALLVKRSLYLMPICLLLVWVCGSKISALFSVLFPLMLYVLDRQFRLSSLFKALSIIFVFYAGMFIIFPDLTVRRYSIESFLFSGLLRLNNADVLLGLGIGFDQMNFFEGLTDSRIRDDTMFSGLLPISFVMAVLVLTGTKRFINSAKNNICEITTMIFVSLATPVTGNPFFIFLLIPVFSFIRNNLGVSKYYRGIQ